LRLVADTNVYVSYLLVPHSTPRRAIDQSLNSGTLLFSEATMQELSTVLGRSKFDRYVSAMERQAFLDVLERAGELIPILQTVRACRDPNDDKFLEVAVNGSADTVVTGDADLLALHPFRGIAITTPAAWLEKQKKP
jgi:uncharacterized protein